MSIASGTRLGPYEIVAPLGAGGMGEVYRARDTRLGREVAIKILPSEVANDVSRRQRFEQEARAVAALSHPNIIAIYDVGEGYIVSELVDGESLRGLKPGLRKTIDIGEQIAAGLAAAHAAGITHRDLKPENILLTRDGRVKILDFGLAKMTAFHEAAAATETLTVKTGPGMVMGTVGYMSPEQVRGQSADYRSDIFSFGLILYELLAGKRAFSGDTSVETMTAILKEDAAELPETVPAGVQQIVAHCLEKDPASRFQSAKDLGFALSQFERPSVTSGAHAVKIWRWRKLVAPAAITAAVAIAFFAGHVLWHPPAPPQWSGTLLGTTAIAQWPRLSPDGHLLAFIGPDSEDFVQVWVMKPESGNRIMLTHRRDLGYAVLGSWSADGSRIFFSRYSEQTKGVFSVPALGGEEQMVLETGSSPEALSDGSLLVNQLNPQQQFQLYRYWPDTGKTRSYDITLPNPDVGTIRGFPDGRHAVVAGAQMKPGLDGTFHLYVVDLESGAMRVLNGDTAGAWGFPAAVTRDGKTVVFVGLHGSMLRVLAVPADGRSVPQPLFNLQGSAYGIDTGTDGSIYVDSQERPENIVRFTPDGRRLEHIAKIVEPPSDDLAVLPDGRAMWVEYIGGRTRLVMGGAGKDSALLVNTTEETSGPLTAVGADAVAFLIGPQGKQDIGVAAVATGRIVSRIPFDKGKIDQMASSPDGKVLYCAAKGSIWAIPAAGGEPRRIAGGNSVTADPDGKCVLVLSHENATTRLIRVPLDGGPERELPINGSLKPAYRISNGSFHNGRLVAPGSAPYWYWVPAIFDISTGKSTRIPLDFVSDFHGMSWTADGSIVAATLDWQTSVWKFTPER